jgi:hypothetical protein
MSLNDAVGELTAKTLDAANDRMRDARAVMAEAKETILDQRELIGALKTANTQACAAIKAGNPRRALAILRRALIALVAVALLVSASMLAPARAEIVAHPAGCPRVLFCGCGVSVRVFGHPVRELFPVTAWYRFPRTAAKSGAVVIFGRYHVAYIETAYGDGTALLYDPNSGGSATRLHRRSIAGLAVVDPQAMAEAAR